MVYLLFKMNLRHPLLLLSLILNVLSSPTKPRYHMYLTGQHPVVPPLPLVENITHIALAFMRSETFNVPNQTIWDLFTTVAETRPKFPNDTKIMVAIGGWGNQDGFSVAAKTEESRLLWAKNVARMVNETGADGVDVDWEYPGGNSDDYKIIPNSEKAWEIAAFPLLLSALRAALGPSKLISAAVPGLRRDMMAFNSTTIPQIDKSLDFWNIMTYDMFNRRDNVTKHHAAPLTNADAYFTQGLPAEKANIGLAFYTKWYFTDPAAHEQCKAKPVGCPTVLMEDPVTGADLGKVGGFSYHDPVPDDVAVSWAKALTDGKYDEQGGGHYYWDEAEDRYWSWDPPAVILKKFTQIIDMGLGGVFAWGLGEDAPKFEHFKASSEGVAKWLEDGGKEDSRREVERSEL